MTAATASDAGSGENGIRWSHDSWEAAVKVAQRQAVALKSGYQRSPEAVNCKIAVAALVQLGGLGQSLDADARDAVRSIVAGALRSAGLLPMALDHIWSLDDVGDGQTATPKAGPSSTPKLVAQRRARMLLGQLVRHGVANDRALELDPKSWARRLGAFAAACHTDDTERTAASVKWQELVDTVRDAILLEGIDPAALADADLRAGIEAVRSDSAVLDCRKVWGVSGSSTGPDPWGGIHDLVHLARDLLDEVSADRSTEPMSQRWALTLAPDVVERALFRDDHVAKEALIARLDTLTDIRLTPEQFEELIAPYGLGVEKAGARHEAIGPAVRAEALRWQTHLLSGHPVAIIPTRSRPLRVPVTRRPSADPVRAVDPERPLGLDSLVGCIMHPRFAPGDPKSYWRQAVDLLLDELADIERSAPSRRSFELALDEGRRGGLMPYSGAMEVPREWVHALKGTAFDDEVTVPYAARLLDGARRRFFFELALHCFPGIEGRFTTRARLVELGLPVEDHLAGWDEF